MENSQLVLTLAPGGGTALSSLRPRENLDFSVTPTLQSPISLKHLSDLPCASGAMSKVAGGALPPRGRAGWSSTGLSALSGQELSAVCGPLSSEAGQSEKTTDGNTPPFKSAHTCGRFLLEHLSKGLQ